MIPETHTDRFVKGALEVKRHWPAVRRRLVDKLEQLRRLDPACVVAIEVLVEARLEGDDSTDTPSPRTLTSRLRAAHPTCSAGEFLQQRPQGGRRSWLCTECGAIVTLPEGGAR